MNKSDSFVTKNEKFTKGIFLILKILLIVLTLIFPVFSNSMTAAGFIFVYGAYGREYYIIGGLLFLSSALMTCATVICLKKPGALSAAIGTAGFIDILVMLTVINFIADKNGWCDPYTLEAASNIYTRRFIPSVIPYILLIILSAAEFFSYDQKQKRHEKKKSKEFL